MFNSKVFPIFGLSENRDISLVDPSVHSPTEMKFVDHPVYLTGSIQTNFIKVGVVPNLISLCVPPEFKADITYEIDPEEILVKSLLIKQTDDPTNTTRIFNISGRYPLVKEDNNTYALRGCFCGDELVERTDDSVTYQQMVVEVDISFNRQTQTLTVGKGPFLSARPIEVLGVYLDLSLISKDRE